MLLSSIVPPSWLERLPALSIPSVLLLTGLLPIVYFLTVQLLVHLRARPILNLPGPAAQSYIFGSLRTIFREPTAVISWLDTYGPTILFRSVLLRPEILTADPRTIEHVFADPDTFARPETQRSNLHEITGKSLIWQEGEQHRRMRKGLVPAFGPSGVRGVMGVFWIKARELRAKLLSTTEGDGDGGMLKLSRLMLRIVDSVDSDPDAPTHRRDDGRRDRPRRVQLRHRLALVA